MASYVVEGSVIGSTTTVTFSGFRGRIISVYAYPHSTNNTAAKTACTMTSNAAISWTPPIEWASYSPNSSSFYIVYEVETDTSTASSVGFIQTHNVKVIYTIPSDVKPTVSFTLTDTTGIFDTHGTLVQNASTLAYDITAEGVYGSTITKYRLTVAIGGTLLSNQVECLSSGAINLPRSGSLYVKIDAIDSRGHSAFVSENSFTVTKYSTPTATVTLANRCDEDGTNNELGNFGRVTINATATKVSSVAEIDYALKYRLRNSLGDYESVSLTDLKNNTDVQDYSIIIPLESSDTYNVYVVVSDALCERQAAIKTIPSASVLVDIDKNNRSVGIGTFAGTPNTLVIGYDTVFRGKTNLTPYKRNLLDNSDFTNPVNQRGITELNATEATPFIDRWLVQPNADVESAHADVQPTWLSTTTAEHLYDGTPVGMRSFWKQVTSSTGEVTNSDGYVYLGNTSSSSGYASIHTMLAYDLTNYTTLRVSIDNLTVGNRLIVGVCSSPYNGTTSADAVSNFSASTVITTSYTLMQTIDVDVSQVTGDMYIQICAGITKVNIYSVDLVGETVTTLNDNPYVSIENGALAQRLEAYKKDTTYTLIACSTDSDDYFVNIEEFNVDGECLTLVNDIPTVLLPAGSWKWAALYEGSYELYNLPSYQPKGYGNELMECHRYYRRFTTSPRPEAVAFYGKINTDKTHIYMQFPVDPPMRITPMANITGGVIVRSPTGSKISEATPTVPYTELNCTVDSARVNNLIISKTDDSVWSGATANYSYAVTLAANSVIELSAEL